MQNWNAFLWPLVVVSREEMYLLTVAVQSIASNTVWTDYGIVFAATTLGSLPILAAFLVVQRGFISGLMSGFGK